MYYVFGHNDDVNHLGIVSFAFTVFPDRFRSDWGIAPMHREMLWEFLYDQPDWQREDRAHVIATFRGGAKTTWFSFLVPTYLICMNDHGIYVGNYKLPSLDYIVLKGKTSRAAQKNMYNVQNALSHPPLVSLFGNLKPTIREVKDKEGKSAGSLLITYNKMVLESLGINQQIRGTNILGKRPKVAIFDDPETGENTKTVERRKNNAMDLLDETWGAMDDKEGRVVYIGNMVHEDCLLKNLLVNPSWKKKFYTLTWKDKDGKEHITWERKYTWAGIEKLKKFYESHPMLGLIAYYRNYYNINKTDSSPIVHDLENIEYHHFQNINWITYERNGHKYTERVYITVGYDAAVTQRAGGSKTAIIAIAQNAKGRKFVLDYKYGIYDVHDRYIEGVDEKDRPIVAIEPGDIARLRRFGGIEESIRMIVKYNADGFAMGTEGQQLGFYNDVVDLMMRMNITCSSMPINTGGKDSSSKPVRLRDWIIRQFEAGVFYVIKTMYELKVEIDTFPQNKMDILDSLYYADRMQLTPNDIEYGEHAGEHIENLIVPNIETEEAWTVA